MVSFWEAIGRNSVSPFKCLFPDHFQLFLGEISPVCRFKYSCNFFVFCFLVFVVFLFLLMLPMLLLATVISFPLYVFVDSSEPCITASTQSLIISIFLFLTHIVYLWNPLGKRLFAPCIFLSFGLFVQDPRCLF